MMVGFFSKTETKSDNHPDGKLRTCYSCGLYSKCDSPKMKPYGNFRKGIMNIGEAPNVIEDHKGIPFQGRTGRLLQTTYEQLGVDLFDDCINLNAINCFPSTDGKIRTPTNSEIDFCRRYIFAYIRQYKPKLIVLLGKSAVYSVIGNRWQGNALSAISDWRGWAIPDQDFKSWICPVFHPSYVEHLQEDTPIVNVVWKDDLKKAFAKLDDDFPVYEKPEITYLNDLKVLNTIKNGSTISFDYETTGLKPHDKDHRIVCCSVAVNENEVFVFEITDDHSKLKPFINVLKNANIKKIAQNSKFEENWSFEILKTRVRGWYWDTMLASHILDNRPGITGLKFQTYVNFGVVDYNESIKSWLDTIDSKNANSKNRIMDLVKTEKGKHQLMEYCALDSIFEFRLAMKQIKEFELQSLPF